MDLREQERQVSIYVGVGDYDVHTCDFPSATQADKALLILPNSLYVSLSYADFSSLPSPFLGLRCLLPEFCHHLQVGSRTLAMGSQPNQLTHNCLVSLPEIFIFKW